MWNTLSQIPSAARQRRPLLVVGSCTALPAEALARPGGHVIEFVSDVDACAWLEEETPYAALFLGMPGSEIVRELSERGVPMLVCGAGLEAGGSDRVRKALRALEE
ncbi:hypothetical protein [Salinarimonas soli]|uniref:Uncharacterized protein n=1 Tax=Salinarimonas soli TaxID=1638099 RepID=A0A5B2V9N6_9HYPH|nr:hypothetical protein [Salinarimonas soli]KAA2235556.1 hypothetical protein F0L46_18810 [Salinarimonas soli]